MLIRKQPPPTALDTDHADYYADVAGKGHFVVNAVDRQVHDGDPVPLAESVSTPATLPDEVQLYTKDAAGIMELFAKNGAGQEAQVTSGGSLLFPPGNNQFFASRQARAEFDVTTQMPAGPFTPPAGPVVLVDLGTTITIPAEGSGDWALLQSRWSYKVAGTLDPPFLGLETLQQTTGLILSDAIGDFTVRGASAVIRFYSGGPSVGFAPYIFPYSLLPAWLLAPPYFPFPVLADDAAVLLLIGPAPPPAYTFRFTGFVDYTVFTIPAVF